MNTNNQTAVQITRKQPELRVFYAIKARCQWPRSFCHICRQKMDHGNRQYAVFEGDTGVLCHACAAKHAPELAQAVEHLYAPRHISGMDLGGLPIDVVVRAEMPLTEVVGTLRALADTLEERADASGSPHDPSKPQP